MRPFVSMIMLALVASVATIPITPAAPQFQRLAERMRLEGLNEHKIAELLMSIPFEERESRPTRLLEQLTFGFHSAVPSKSSTRDHSGDIAPGSMDAPQMLPRAITSDSESLLDAIGNMLGVGHRKERGFGYEGKELEMRRPEGMRHWDSQV